MDKIHHLFQGITKSEYDQMVLCFHAKEKKYNPGELICSYGENSSSIGVILEGHLHLIRTHVDGRQTILENIDTGDIFGEPFSFVTHTESSIQVYSITYSRILYMDYSHLIKRCSKACPYHSILVNNALQMLSQKAVQLSQRLEILSQRTTREKLCCYFSILSIQNQSSTFSLPFSFSSLADYLSVDRSAMMREIKKMKNDGMISSSRHEITLLKDFCYNTSWHKIK